MAQPSVGYLHRQLAGVLDGGHPGGNATESVARHDYTGQPLIPLLLGSWTYQSFILMSACSVLILKGRSDCHLKIKQIPQVSARSLYARPMRFSQSLRNCIKMIAPVKFCSLILASHSLENIQAGVAMGLAKTVATRFPDWGPEFATLMVSFLLHTLCYGC